MRKLRLHEEQKICPRLLDTNAHGIGNRLNSLIFMPAMGLNQSAAIVVGQNLGAGLIERAKKSGQYSLKMVFLILTAIGILLFIFPTTFISIFTNDKDVLELGKYYVRFLAIGYPFIGMRIVMNGIFQGAGDSFLVMILSLVSLWVFRAPMAIGLSYTSLGIKGIWLGIGLSFIVSALFMLIWFLKGNWLNKTIVTTSIEKHN